MRGDREVADTRSVGQNHRHGRRLPAVAPAGFKNVGDGSRPQRIARQGEGDRGREFRRPVVVEECVEPNQMGPQRIAALRQAGEERRGDRDGEAQAIAGARRIRLPAGGGEPVQMRRVFNSRAAVVAACVRGDLISALNAFDLLEKQFPNSKSLPEAIELAIKMLTPLKAQAAARVAAFPTEKAATEKAISAALEPSKSEMRAAADRAKAAGDSAVAAAQQKGLKWPPFIPKSELAMKQIAEKAGIDLTRLGAIDLGKIRQSIELTDKARQAIAANDFAAAEEALKKARPLWEGNELLPRLAADLAAAKAAAAAKPAATPTPATPKPIAKKTDVDMPADEPPPSNPWLKIVLGVLAAGLGGFGWRVYKSIKAKANEVLE